jgi:tryptophanyl-tRNA synthetase
MKKRIFSGIQPSGALHLGNYLGAIKNWVELQDKFEPIFCVVDLHAITVPQKPKELRQKTIEVAKTYLAAGIDPKKATIFVQSRVQEHTELAWMLNTITKLPELERMTQFKDKSQQQQNVNAGLFNYPVLMAADILLYDTNIVPVGEDQVQHIEMTRTLARRFNQMFGETFIVPEAFVVKEGMRIMGLDDPTKKMSKSAESAFNYISLADDPDTVREKIKKAVTDSEKEIRYSDEKPAIKNLINIYSLLDNIKPKEIEDIYRDKRYSEFKSDLAETIVGFLEQFQEKYNDIEDNDVLKILEEGRKKAQELAEKKMEKVKEKMGFL